MDNTVINSVAMPTGKMLIASDEYYDSYPNDEGANHSVNGNVILGIVIGVCAIAGIALGIILGRRAARK